MLLDFVNGGDCSFTTAAAQIDIAVDTLREAGSQDYLPPGLLVRAQPHRVAVQAGVASSASDVERDLDEVTDIALRDAPNGGTMRLHLCDAHLEYARLRLAEGRPDDARPHFETAEALVNECGYHRRDREIDDLRNRHPTPYPLHVIVPMQ